MDKFKKIRKKMETFDVDGFLVTDSTNIRYVSGFTGSAGTILITQDKAFFLSDFRYKQQADDQVKDFEIIIYEQSIYLQKNINKIINDLNLKKLAFEADSLSHSRYLSLKENMSAELIGVDSFFSEFREQKREDEIEKIKRAAEITDQAYLKILEFIEPGKSELEVANELEYILKSLGSDFNSRDMTVASGIRSSLPHGRPSEKIIGENDMVILDFGAVYEGYHSDMTRTVSFGSPDKKLIEIYGIVHAALKHCEANVKIGMDGREVDSLVRDYIDKEGYGKYFGHGSGHGIGLAIHEDPFFSPVSDHILLENMVVTIEPGIYIPGLGGVRIENNLIIREGNHEIITKSEITNY